MPIFNSTIAVIALIMYLITIWHGVVVKDYGIAIESFAYFTVSGVTPVFYISVIRNTNVILKIAEDMNNSFIEVCALGPRYKFVYNVFVESK